MEGGSLRTRVFYAERSFLLYIWLPDLLWYVCVAMTFQILTF